jgi:hypothetical protein
MLLHLIMRGSLRSTKKFAGSIAEVHMNKHRGRHSEKRRRQLVYGRGSPIFDTRIRKGSYPPMPIIEFPKGGLGSVPVFRKTKKKKY